MSREVLLFLMEWIAVKFDVMYIFIGGFQIPLLNFLNFRFE
jgi:hypothetical protein